MTPIAGSADHYAGVADRWATGAAKVYRPLARELVARSPRPLARVRMIEVGTGTGVGTNAAEAAGAIVVAAFDRSIDMLGWDRSHRPPAGIADVNHLPVASDVVGGVIAAFVLNHVDTPLEALREMARVTRPGGVALVSVYAEAMSSRRRDAVDRVAGEHGWTAPDWHRHLKEVSAPLLGSAERMAAAATTAGIDPFRVDEVVIDVGIDTAADLVGYRFGQAQFREWFDRLVPVERRAVVDEAARSADSITEPFRPTVVFLGGIVV